MEDYSHAYTIIIGMGSSFLGLPGELHIIIVNTNSYSRCKAISMGMQRADSISSTVPS